MRFVQDIFPLGSQLVAWLGTASATNRYTFYEDVESLDTIRLRNRVLPHAPIVRLVAIVIFMVRIKLDFRPREMKVVHFRAWLIGMTRL